MCEKGALLWRVTSVFWKNSSNVCKVDKTANDVYSPENHDGPDFKWHSVKWCCRQQPQMWAVWDSVILTFPSGCRKVVPCWVLDGLHSKYSRHIQALLVLQASVQGMVHFKAFKRNKKMSRHWSLAVISSSLTNFGVWILPSPPWERVLCLPLVSHSVWELDCSCWLVFSLIDL